MKLRLSSLLLGFCIALATGLPALAKSRVDHPRPGVHKVAHKGAAAAVQPKASTKQGSVLKVSGRKATAHKMSARSRITLGKARLGLARNGQQRRFALVAEAPARVSFGQMQGLHAEVDALELKSSVALVIDQDTNEVLFSKNSGAVLPIASITKLMTGLVVFEARLPMDEVLTITQDDVDTEKGSRSRLAVGTQLTRGEMLHLALMSSENRAANALGRSFPGGLDGFVAAMNRRAGLLGMRGTRYVEPTGLSSANQSTAQDLALLVREAHSVPLLRELSTSHETQVAVGHRMVQFHNTNRLVQNPEWDIGLQKTGYISEAGRCLVMQAHMAGRKLIMVLLDSTGKYSRLGDAERIRRWLATSAVRVVVPARNS